MSRCIHCLAYTEQISNILCNRCLPLIPDELWVRWKQAVQKCAMSRRINRGKADRHLADHLNDVFKEIRNALQTK